jgi:fructose-bisphosphate aldolase class I
LAMDESNATCGLRLASIGLENTEVNRQAYRQLLVGTPGLGVYLWSYPFRRDVVPVHN